MKFNGQLLAALAGLCSVHAFNVGAPVSVRSQQTGVQRSRWVSMPDKAPAAAAAAPVKKRSIDVEFIQETPGGYISVLQVKNFKTITNHRIVMSKDELSTYSGLAGRELDISDFVKYIVKYMMDKGMKLDNTEGMIDSSVFPVNYFTLKQLSYFHDDVEDKLAQICKDAPDLAEL